LIVTVYEEKKEKDSRTTHRSDVNITHSNAGSDDVTHTEHCVTTL